MNHRYKGATPNDVAGALLRYKPRPTRRVQSGITTSDLILSAHMTGNSEVFAKILDLHVPIGSRVADVTYGKGVFWRKIDPGAYTVVPSDIATGTDCRNLPYENESFDCVVLDPPYMEGFYRTNKDARAGNGTYRPFSDFYSNGSEGPKPTAKHQAAVFEMYVQSGREVSRVLRAGGIAIVKCQDAVSANKQWLTHIDIVNTYEEHGFYSRDVFVTVRKNKPAVSRILKQVHARKNHSYFIVFEKKAAWG